jgi:hypothetical protein
MGGGKEERVIASFECRAKGSGGVARNLIPTLMAMVALLGSQFESNPELIIAFFVLLGVVASVAPVLVTMLPRTKTTCTLTDSGIGLKAVKPPKSRVRFYRWRNLARYSAKPMGVKGGRIYLYPKKPLAIFRREVIETLNLADYQVLYNMVASRVGLF